MKTEKATKMDHGEEKFLRPVKKKYLADPNDHCPFCGGKSMEPLEQDSPTSGRIDIKVHCLRKACGRTWFEHYIINDISVEG